MLLSMRNLMEASLNFTKEIQHERRVVRGLPVVWICGGYKHYHPLAIGCQIQVRQYTGISEPTLRPLA